MLGMIPMDVMYGFNLQSMTEEEIEKFDDIFDIAISLRDRHKKRRQEKMEQLVEHGTIAVRPLLYSLERCYVHGDDRTMEEMEDRAGEVIQKIGPRAFPVLVEEAYNGNVLVPVNEFAREMVWKICQQNGIAPVNSVPESEIYNFDYSKWHEGYSKRSKEGE